MREFDCGVVTHPIPCLVCPPPPRQWNPDCKDDPCDCPGTEVPGPPPHDASWDTVRSALEMAWSWGYASAEADALNRPYSDRPEAATWKPTTNPYTEQAPRG